MHGFTQSIAKFTKLSSSLWRQGLKSALLPHTVRQCPQGKRFRFWWSGFASQEAPGLTFHLEKGWTEAMACLQEDKWRRCKEHSVYLRHNYPITPRCRILGITPQWLMLSRLWFSGPRFSHGLPDCWRQLVDDRRLSGLLKTSRKRQLFSRNCFCPSVTHFMPRINVPWELAK